MQTARTMSAADYKWRIDMLGDAVKGTPQADQADYAAAIDIFAAVPPLLHLTPEELKGRLAALALSAKPVLGDRFRKMLVRVPGC